MKKTRVVILGAGFGGLELSTLLSERLGDAVDVTLIDKAETFVFGFSKLDAMFGRAAPEAVRLTLCRHREARSPFRQAGSDRDRPECPAGHHRSWDLRG